MKSQEEQWLLESFNSEKTDEYFAALRRLHDGEPLAYIIGSIPFLNCDIHLDNQPLIPRVETEFWVEKAIMSVKETEVRTGEPVGILDLCAGSGCVGVAVAKGVSQARVDFAEIDPRLLPTIQKNIDVNISDTSRCSVFQSDVFSGLPADKKYHFILTNPPYIDPILDRTEIAVKNFEPHLALYGGAAGMERISTIITEASAHLHPDGQLWIEHEPEQANEITNLATTNNFFCTHHTDQYDIVRYSILVIQST